MSEIERLQRTVAKQEDALFRQSASILRLIGEIDRLTAANAPTSAALRARRVAKEERAALVRTYQEQGKSIAQTALILGITPRTVSRHRSKS